MINPVSEQQAKGLHERLSNPMERFDAFPEPNDYSSWIRKIADFIAWKGGSSAFGVEKYRGDLEFFSADNSEECAMLFLSKFTPHELVFFGLDWIIGISSYPECEGSDTLEYAIRLYGTAIIIERCEDTVQFEGRFGANRLP